MIWHILGGQKMKTPSDINPPLTGLIDVTLQLFLIGPKLEGKHGLNRKIRENVWWKICHLLSGAN